tara:strand:+ start:5717 stop:6040 length:324 start_codon:yes stop_codon:yes gene_type:complete
MPARPFSKVVTANALIDGDVVYLDAAGAWVGTLNAAQVFTDKDSANEALTRAQARSHEVVGCYLADVDVTEAGLAPTHFREEFRRRGPSNYAHGKQATAKGSPHVSL